MEVATHFCSSRPPCLFFLQIRNRVPQLSYLSLAGCYKFTGTSSAQFSQLLELDVSRCHKLKQLGPGGGGVGSIRSGSFWNACNCVIQLNLKSHSRFQASPAPHPVGPDYHILMLQGATHRFVSRQTALQVLHMEHTSASSIELSLPRLREMSLSGDSLNTVCRCTACLCLEAPC